MHDIVNQVHSTIHIFDTNKHYLNIKSRLYVLAMVIGDYESIRFPKKINTIPHLIVAKYD